MKTIKLLIYIFSFSIALYGAQLLLSEVLQMYKKDELKNNTQAIELLKSEALAGNEDATFLLATAYKNGKTGEVNIKKAMHWYRVAAKNGDTDAMLMLGWLYYKEPKNLNVNLKKARYWFKKASLQGVEEGVEMLELLRRL